MSASSRNELATELAGRDGAFSDFEIGVDADVFGAKAVAEWVVSVAHTGPLVIDDEIVIEPTGRRITLRG